MPLFSFNKKEKPVLAPVDNTPSMQFYSLKNNYTSNNEFITTNPLVKVFGVYVNGENNLFPNYINFIKKRSPLHSTIINFKSVLTVGNGYTYTDIKLDINNEIALKQLLFQYDDILDDIAKDYWNASKIYLKILWNEAHTKIIEVKHMPHEKIRVKDVNQQYEPITYEYCYDWANVSRFPRICYAKFNQSDKENKEQIMQFEIKTEGQIIYNEPQWIAALDWCEQDGLTAEYHSSNMNNSINVSALVEFFRGKTTPEQQKQIMDNLNKTYSGAKNAGKVMGIFNNDIETAAKFTQIEANKLDKTFIVLSDTIQRQICYAHGIDPQILGLKTPGSLGNSLSLPESFKLFNYAQIAPAQKDIEKILNKLIAINGLPVKIKLNSATNLFEDSNK